MGIQRKSVLGKIDGMGPLKLFHHYTNTLFHLFFDFNHFEMTRFSTYYLYGKTVISTLTLLSLLGPLNSSFTLFNVTPAAAEEDPSIHDITLIDLHL